MTLDIIYSQITEAVRYLFFQFREAFVKYFYNSALSTGS